jgi:DNA repair protein RadA/Sms
VAAVAGAGASAVARARASPSASRVTLPGPDGAEVGRVLGGGVVRGALTLIGGDPGVGKSTLLLQVAALLGGHLAAPAAASTPPPMVLYASAEESVDQVGARAARLGLADAAPGLHLLSATRVEDLLPLLAASPPPAALVVDSIQTVYLDAAPGAAGSVTQVRECAAALMRVAKAAGVPVFLVGHVTKSGDVAGPRVLEHLVDAVLYLEGSRHADLRILRAVKNRYGPTDEVGVFRMDEGGLRAVPNPSAALVAERALAPSVASAVTVAVEGSRPLLLEVQALVAAASGGWEGGGASGGPGSAAPPLRSPGGVRRDRLALIIAVLAKHARLRLGRADVHTNVVGGLDLREPAADLAVAVALASSALDAPARRDAAAFGEVGLGGELRRVPALAPRLAEAAKLGFKLAVIPAAQDLDGIGGVVGGGKGGAAGGAQPKELLYKGGMRLVRAATLSDALAVLLPDSVGAAGRRRRSGAGGVGGRRRAVGAGSEGEEGEEEEEEGEAAGW